MEKIETKHLTAEQKRSALLKAALEQFPAATELDVQKLTPTGEKLNQAIRHAARVMFAKSGDDSWLTEGKKLGNLASTLSIKPASSPGIATK